MGTISNIISSILPPTTGSKPSSSNATTGNSTGVYGAAYEISINQHKNADGGFTDSVTYASYSGSIDKTSTTAATGTGSDFKSAYESLMHILAGGDSEAQKADLSGIKDTVDSLVNQLGDSGDDASATAAKGGLLTEVGAPFKHESGDIASSDLLEEFMNSVINSLNRNLKAGPPTTSQEAADANKIIAAAEHGYA